MLVSHWEVPGSRVLWAKASVDLGLTQGPLLVFEWFPLTVELRGPRIPLDWRTPKGVFQRWNSREK